MLLSVLEYPGLRYSIVEKQDSPQQCAFTCALCADEMHVAVKIYVGVTYSCAVDEYNFIEVSHVVYLLEY